MPTVDVIKLLLVFKQLLPCVAVHRKFGEESDSEEEMETDSGQVRFGADRKMA